MTEDLSSRTPTHEDLMEAMGRLAEKIDQRNGHVEALVKSARHVVKLTDGHALLAAEMDIPALRAALKAFESEGK